MTLIETRMMLVPRAKSSLIREKVIAYLILSVMCFFTFVPFYFMFIFASWDKSQIFSLPPHVVPGPDLAHNYDILMSKVNLWRSFWNSLYIAVVGTVLAAFFCSLGGFGFAMYEFRFKNALFSLVLGSLLIPSLLGIIPFYLIMQAIGWIGEPKALYIPGAASAIGIFLMRQYITSAIPKELVEAGRLDGCSEFRIFWNIVLPLLGPAIAYLSLTGFVASWNNLIGPLIVLREPALRTLPAALSSLRGVSGIEYGALLLGVCVSVIPLMILFVIMSRNLISGLAAGAVKG